MLENYVNRLISNVEEELNRMPDATNQLKLFTLKASLYSQAIKELNNKIIQHEFQDLNEEIHFFKYLKPKLLSQQHYCFHRAQILQECHNLSKCGRDEILSAKLSAIDSFFKIHHKFCTYHEMGHTHKDNRYYVRMSNRAFHNLDYNLADKDFRTTCEKGHILGKIHSKKLLSKYLQKVIHLEPLHDMTKGLPIVSTLKYNGTPTELVELVYALKEAGLVDDNISRISEVLGRVLGISEINTYKIWQKIKERKIDQTRLLTKLQKSLTKRIKQEIEA